MDFTVEHIKGVALIKIKLDRADIRSAEKFKNFIQDLLNDGYSKILLDCSKVTFMDSTFLGAIVVSLKRCVQGGGDLKFIACDCKDTMVWTLFETTRMFSVFQIFDDFDKAIDSFTDGTQQN